MMLETMPLSLQFYEPSKSNIEGEVSMLIESGCRRFLLVSHNNETFFIEKHSVDKEDVFFHMIKGEEIHTIDSKIKEYDAVVFFEDIEADSLSKALLFCLDMERGVVLAPITDDHFSRRPFFIMTIPKSGTHMLIGILETMGINRNNSSIPMPGRWNTVGDFNYHVPCKDFFEYEWVNPSGLNPLFRSPAIFMYRNPLDIVASESVWYLKSESPFSHYIETLDGPDERLLALIEDSLVMGNIRDRISRYIGWMDFSNVIPISYEELVGSRGGGNDADQHRSIWSLQLKLHFPGSPNKLGSKLYDQNSPTFFKGKIGRYKDIFKKIHYDSFKSLPQDFMEKMGYDINNPGQPCFVEHFRRRPLSLWRPSEKEIWQQRLVRETNLGHNIVAVAGQYAVISQSCGNIDLSQEVARNRPGVHMGFPSLDDALHFIYFNEYDKKTTMLEKELAERDIRMDNLQKELAERDIRMDNLQKELADLKSERWYRLMHWFLRTFVRVRKMIS